MFARILFGLAGVVAVVCLPSKAPAATIVSWGGNYVSSSTGFRGSLLSGSAQLEGGTGLDGYTRRPFSEDVEMQPAFPSYVGPPFYGGYEFIRVDNPTPPSSSTVEARVANYTSADTLRFYWSFSQSVPFVARGMVMFQKPDFRELSDVDVTVRFSDGDALKLSVYTLAPGDGTARFVVRDGDTYFASSASFNTAGAKELKPAETQWKAWNPETKLDFDESQTGFAPHQFDDVTAVGFYWEVSKTSTTARFEVSSFSATATALPPAQPEPEPQPEPDPGQTNPVPTPQALVAGLLGLAWVVGRRLWR